ncbi:hypothetical protein L3X38_004225 [Prunus dulcis]|uniref:Reverse transcriptase Ty1/copia-type domain-containing protein n=1 Tax=Prunus dulcis TaxID=3755 RepID=A0AAD5F2Z9_PRUDU|nr:hypothetical protein L3X38_004225 [Prunus dulcis]
MFETPVGNRNFGFISIDSVSYEESSKASSRLEDTQNFDHTPLKWRKLDDILAQCNLCTMEPEKFEEAVKDESWMKAMKDELNMIEKNDTWELVDRSMDKLVIGVKWVFKTKLNLDAQKGWQLYQLDVKSAFLNGILEEEVYVDQLKGFVVKGSESKVYKLHKALYGLKQAPRAWYSEIDGYFAECGFTKSQSEATLYVKARGEASILIVSIYVDDIVYTGNDQEMLEDFMKEKYEMTDLGLLHHFLGMGVIQTPTSRFIHQKKYATTLLNRFGLNECKPVSIPLVTLEKLSKDDGSGLASDRRIIESLLYLIATRPDIMFVASLLARFMHCPTSKHLGTTKRVLRYVKGTLDYGLDGVFAWASVKQNCVALSTAKAEYISASEATIQAIWLRFVLEDFGELQTEATPLQCDNISAIAITRNPVFHQKTKHIDRREKFGVKSAHNLKGSVEIIRPDHENCFSTLPWQEPRGKQTQLVLSIQELKQAGVKLKADTNRQPLDISFSSTLRGKVLAIPPIHIDDHRGTSFRTLLALNMSPALPPRCYKLFVFLDDLIISSKDVGLLYYHRVLQHSLGSNRMVAKLVNKRQGSWAGRTGCGVAGARRDLGHEFSFISFLKYFVYNVRACGKDSRLQ